MAIIKRSYRTKKQKKPVIFYQAEVFIKGARVSVKTFRTKREAVLWHEKEQCKFTFSPASLNDQMTFKECLDRFFEDAKTRIMRVTLQRYEQHAVYLYNTPLAKTKMSELKGIKIVEWIDWLKKHPTAKSLKRSSFVEELRCLKTVLFWYKNFLNEDFNVPITKKHKQFCFLRPKTPRRPDYFIKPEDAKKWVEWLKANRSNPVYWRIATFMLLTGTRVSEACGLKWDVVDLERSMVRIVRRVSWDKINKNPSLDNVTKTTNSARLLILPKRLQALLSQMKKEAVGDLVFTDSKGELLRYNAIQSAFNAGFEALNLPWRSTHICRHTFATLALMETKNLSAVQASLGHTEQKTTQVYAKTVALLSSETGEKTASVIFKDSQLFWENS
ncbi:MAG: site-specific integrase [Bdellovibrionales bacterium]|nr:site-specific integrase [Bdellovibrionales bacterium]